MKTGKYYSNRNKSQNNKLLNKNTISDKRVSLTNNNISTKRKSKNKKNNFLGNSIRPKSKEKPIRNNNFKNELINQDINNSINFNNNRIFNYNKDINKNLANNKSSIKNSIYEDSNIFDISNNNSKIHLYNSNKNTNINNDFIDNSNIFKKTLDRLLYTSNNLLEKQNNILKDCDILAKNVAMNDYTIKTITTNGNKSNFYNNIDNYSNNIFSLFSQLKKNKNNSQTKEELTNENNYLKKKLEMLNITQEDNIKQKDGEITNLKIILVSEINHIINFLQEIGYDNIPLNKIEISEITSQKLTNFFELIIKIIKQMKELIQKKDSIISKISIENNTLRDYKNEDFNNKSFEKLSIDFNNHNLGLKNYNFSVKNSNQKKKFNISFRNYVINNNKNDIDNIASIEYNNNKSSIQLGNELINDKNKENNNNNDIGTNKEGNFVINDKMKNNSGINVDIMKDINRKNDEYIYNKEKSNIY